MSLTRAIWIEDFAFLRAASEFYVFGLIVVLGARASWPALSLLAGWGGLWAYLVYDFMSFR